MVVEAEPHKFLLPRESDMRFNWLHARLDALEPDEMRNLVLRRLALRGPQARGDRVRAASPSAKRVIGSKRRRNRGGGGGCSRWRAGFFRGTHSSELFLCERGIDSPPGGAWGMWPPREQRTCGALVGRGDSAGPVPRQSSPWRTERSRVRPLVRGGQGTGVALGRAGLGLERLRPRGRASDRSTRARGSAALRRG